MAKLKEFPCPNCSSELNYDAEKRNLICLHCSYVVEISKNAVLITENAINDFKELPKNSLEEIISKDRYKCSKCGCETEFSTDIAALECSQCGNNVVNIEAYDTHSIRPSSIIPFFISKNKGIEIFKDWVGKGFWNDTSLKDLAITESLEGHYVPFWTFDANTHNNWSGYSGSYYYVEESYTDSDNRRQTRSVQKTDWDYREGEFSLFFDDVLICGNKEISQDYINEIYPYELEKLETLDEKYLLGWHAKAFDKDTNECFEIFKDYAKKIIYSKSEDKLRQDTYRDLEVNTTFSDETYKHIILPIWHCLYLFKGKKYSFIINGQTGKISGEKPLSTTKIVGAVVIIIIVIVLLFLAMN